MIPILCSMLHTLGYSRLFQEFFVPLELIGLLLNLFDSPAICLKWDVVHGLIILCEDLVLY